MGILVESYPRMKFALFLNLIAVNALQCYRCGGQGQKPCTDRMQGNRVIKCGTKPNSRSACYVGSNANGDIVSDCINRSHVRELDDREIDEFIEDPQAQAKFKFKWQKTSKPRNPMKITGNLVFDNHVLCIKLCDTDQCNGDSLIPNCFEPFQAYKPLQAYN